jgi:phage terminase Nu1 subunit (DNA packaging protein)
MEVREGNMPDWRKLSSDEVASALDLTTMAVSKWVSVGCPHIREEIDCRPRHFFDLALVMKWKVDRELARPVAADVESPELERYRKLKADMTEFDLSVKKKKFMETAVIRAMVRKMAERCRIGFQSLGKRLSIRLGRESDPAAVERILDDEVATILKGLSNIRLDGIESDHPEQIPADVEQLDLIDKEETP